MEAITLFQQARLDDAFASLTTALRSRPADIDLRYTMVGLLALRGEYDRALVHLEFIAGERPELATAVAMYVSSIHGEEERRRAYDAGHVLGCDPTTEVAVKARAALRQALAARDEAAAAAAMATIAAEPAVAALVDGRAVADLRDHDDGVGTVLEVFVGGRCLWVPFAQLRSLKFTPPRGLLDLIWAQCVVETTQGTRYTCHVPALYCGTHGRADAQVRCGQKTEWVDELGIAFRGFGQRVLLAGDQELELLRVREVKFGAAAGAP
jgi:type VI secretion system protein ImpE